MTNTVIAPPEFKHRIYTEQHHAKIAPTAAGEVLSRGGGFVHVRHKVPTRCVRGVPLSDPVWFPGDGKAGEDKPKKNVGGRYPLEEEFKAKRLGKWSDEDGIIFGMSEGVVLWETAKWFSAHYELANRPLLACSYGIGTVASGGDLGGYVDREAEGSKGSSDPEGFQIEMNPLYRLGKVEASSIESTGPRESKLHPAESRARSIKICQHLKYRLDCNYRHVVDAVVHRCEMRSIGLAEGVREGAAAAGRMLLRAGLRTATLVRSDIARWEANVEKGTAGPVGPLPYKPIVFGPFSQKAANDDVRQHVRNVA